MSAAAAVDQAQELERATSDYLAVSRNAHLYATTGDYELAERRAWERVERALAAQRSTG